MDNPNTSTYHIDMINKLFGVGSHEKPWFWFKRIGPAAGSVRCNNKNETHAPEMLAFAAEEKVQVPAEDGLYTPCISSKPILAKALASYKY